MHPYESTHPKAAEDRKRAELEARSNPHLANRELLWYHPTSQRLTKTRMQMVGVKKFDTRRRRFQKNLLVIGTGRCGTTWLSKTLEKAGFDIPHECVGEQGSVSLFFHSDHEWYPLIPWATNFPFRKAHVGERRSDFEFHHVAHIVRHPLEFEASARSILNIMEMYWAQEAGVLTVPWDVKPVKLRSLFYWRDVVNLCESLAAQTIPLNRVKNNDSWWRQMLNEAGLPDVPRPELPPNNKSSGFKKHEPMTWDEVSTLDAALARDLKRMTTRLNLE